MLKATPPDLFFTKSDKQDIRLGDLGQTCDFNQIINTQSDLYLWGYPDDEGIGMNGGRTGARLAPEKIRRFFYKMTPPFLITDQNRTNILDLGDVLTTKPLADRHQNGMVIRETLTKLQKKSASLGGGHDYGYADAAGFLRAHKNSKEKPIIINFDAHLDVRPTDKGFHSGTPFFRILNEFKFEFEFFEVGLQPQCNSAHHTQWAENQGAELIWIQDLRAKPLLSVLQEKLGNSFGRPLFISIDMDAFCISEAPGCSQSWPGGLTYDQFEPAFTWLLENFKCQDLGIYEVSPELDVSDKTSKLAALILYRFLFHGKIK